MTDSVESNKPTISGFLRAVEREVLERTEEGKISFQICAADHVIEMRFASASNAQTVSRFMVGMSPEKTREADAVIYYWSEDCSHFLPAGAERDTTSVWQSRDGTGYLRLTPRFNMVGADFERNVYYYCRHPSKATEHLLYGHAMVLSLGQWALHNGMLLLHSACVGINGKGVMISARGGEGKSTLAVSCLLGGFDFVADDALLVNQTGPLTAWPLYRTVGLNQDMNALLCPDMPVVYEDPRRNGKLLLDASGFRYAPLLPVCAILYPRVTSAPEPSIRRIPPGGVLAKVIDSTSVLLGLFRDQNAYRLMAQRLLGLPVYELSLCHDLNRNREFLKNFIVKEL